MFPQTKANLRRLSDELISLRQSHKALDARNKAQTAQLFRHCLQNVRADPEYRAMCDPTRQALSLIPSEFNN